MIGKFFHIPKPKQFNFTTRFYDPDKEEREDRIRRIKDEMGIKDETEPKGPYRPHIKGSFRQANSWQAKSTAQARKSSNTRLIILILIFVLIAYLFFYSDLIK